MARILIGNVKGPIGATGPVGPRGPEGPQGIQGPLCPLTNNALATVPGVAALDAVMGKTLSDKDTALQNEVTKLNSDLSIVGNCYSKDFTHTKVAAPAEVVATLAVPRGTYVVFGYFRTDSVAISPKGWWCFASGSNPIGSNAPINISAMNCVGIATQITEITASVIGLSPGDVINGYVQAVRID
ncbi:MAG: hypothetical protein RSD33_10200 [Clostridium sp.]